MLVTSDSSVTYTKYSAPLTTKTKTRKVLISYTYMYFVHTYVLFCIKFLNIIRKLSQIWHNAAIVKNQTSSIDSDSLTYCTCLHCYVDIGDGVVSFQANSPPYAVYPLLYFTEGVQVTIHCFLGIKRTSV